MSRIPMKRISLMPALQTVIMNQTCLKKVRWVFKRTKMVLLYFLNYSVKSAKENNVVVTFAENLILLKLVLKFITLTEIENIMSLAIINGSVFLVIKRFITVNWSDSAGGERLHNTSRKDRLY